MSFNGAKIKGSPAHHCPDIINLSRKDQRSYHRSQPRGEPDKLRVNALRLAVKFCVFP